MVSRDGRIVHAISELLGDGAPYQNGIAWFCDGDFGPFPRIYYLSPVLYINRAPTHDLLASKVEAILVWARKEGITLGEIKTKTR